MTIPGAITDDLERLTRAVDLTCEQMDRLRVEVVTLRSVVGAYLATHDKLAATYGRGGEGAACDCALCVDAREALRTTARA